MIKLNFVYTPKEPEKIESCLKELDKYAVSCGGDILENSALPEQLLNRVKTEHWSLVDDSVNHVNLDFVLENLSDAELLHVFNELNRVCCDGALIEIKSHHPKVLPESLVNGAHGLNDRKLRVLDAQFRKLNPQALSEVYGASALDSNPLQVEFNWEFLNFNLHLSAGAVQYINAQHLTELSAILHAVSQDPMMLQYSEVSMVVHKVPGRVFGRVSFPSVPPFIMSLYSLETSQFVSRLVKTHGRFEVEETTLLFSILDAMHAKRQRSGVEGHLKIANIGANLGWYALVSTMGRDFVKVDAFEPTPDTVEKLQQSIHLNNLESKITVYPIALSDAKGTCELFVDKQNAGSNSLREAKTEGHDIGQVLQIEADTMDNIYLTQPREAWPDILVMDVEGHEQKVLDGAQQMLAEHRDDKSWRPVIFAEFSPSLMVLRGECTYYRDLTENFDYRAFILEHGKLNSLIPITPDEIEKQYELLKENNPSDRHFDLVLLPSKVLDILNIK